jgi:signal transduction histidine kinase
MSFKKLFTKINISILVIIFLIAYIFNSCNKIKQTKAIDLQAHVNIENKFHISYDTVYLNNILDSLENTASSTQDTKVLTYYLSFIKYFYGYKNYTQMYVYADTLETYLVQKNLTKSYPNYYEDALYAKGDYFFETLKYEDALRYYYEAKKFEDEQKLDSCTYSKYFSKMRIFYYDKGEYQKAIPFINLNIKQIENCNPNNNVQLSFTRLQADMNTLALCYEKMGMFDSAIYYYKKGIQYVLSKENTTEIPTKKIDLSLGIYYGNLGGTFLLDKQYDSAAFYLNKSIKLNDRPGYDLVDVQTAYLKLATLYLETNQPALAKPIIDKTKEFVTTPKYFASTLTRSKWYLLNFNYYKQTSNLHQAIDAYSLYHHIQDSINTVTSNINTFSVAKEVDRIKVEYKNREIEKANEIKTIYNIVISVVVALLIIIIVLFIKNLKQSKLSNYRAKLHNIELKNTLQQLQLSNKNYARVMKVMAHDLRSPFSGIIGITDILLNDENISTKERNEMLELMQTSANNSLTMIGELLQSSSSFEQREIVKQPLDIIVLLKQCIELLKFKASEKQQTIHYHHAAASVQVMADSEKLWRLFSNLIMNAIKFSQHNKTIYVYVERYADEEVIVSIQDEGIGIPDKFKDSVFEMFTDAKRKGTAGEQPFGIGLSICKQIVEAHNGKIWFISNNPHGTTFYVALPL